MEAEDDNLHRPSPPSPYRAGAAQLRVPVQAFSASLQLLQAAGRRESGLFWYGPRDSNGSGTVGYVVAPRQIMTWGNYSVSTEALTEIVQGLPEDYKPLAQVHSHPRAGVEHSRYDDRLTSSKRALSIVFPHYGHYRGPFPAGLGVHEWQDSYWHLLEPITAGRRVVLVEGPVRVEDRR